MLRLLRPFFATLWLELQIFYYRWALHDMHPLHPDVPRNVLTLQQLMDARP
jgi:hypothetical protein